MLKSFCWQFREQAFWYVVIRPGTKYSRLLKIRL